MSTNNTEVKKLIVNTLETKARQDVPAKGLRAFKDRPFPNATIFLDNKNYILISVSNEMDGVGDFMHLQNFGQETKRLASDQGYTIIGVLTIPTAFPLDKKEGQREILSTIAKQLSTHCFDRLYIMLPSPDQIDIFKNAKLDSAATDYQETIDILSAFKPNNVVFQTLASSFEASSLYYLDCEKVGLHLSIRSGGLGQPYFPVSAKKIAISEYRCGMFSGLPFDATDGAPMELGKISETSDCFGIKLHRFQKKTGLEKAERLYNFENKNFLQLLLNNQNPSIALAHAYFSNHVLCPGYLQSYGSTAIFIAAHVYKHLNTQGVLTKNCDFYLNQKFVDEALISKVLEKLNLDINFFTFITPDTKLQNLKTGTPQVRIFCNFFLSNTDYKDLYLLTEGGAACSGDNSCSNVFSSESIPFAMRLGRQSQFLSDFWNHFPEFLGAFENLEKSSRLQFEKLHAYFSELRTPDFGDCSYTQFSQNLDAKIHSKTQDFFQKYSTSNDGFFTRMTPEALTQHIKLIVIRVLHPDEEIKHFIEKHVTLAKKFGTFLQDPKLQTEWAAFREMLTREYNYSKNYEDFILKGALYVAAQQYTANPSLEASSAVDVPSKPVSESSAIPTLNSAEPPPVIFRASTPVSNDNLFPPATRNRRDPMGICSRLS
jgi:hypothetical protein